MLSGRAFFYIKAKVYHLFGWDNSRKRRYTSVEPEVGTFSVESPPLKMSKFSDDYISHSLGMDKSNIQNSTASQQHQLFESGDADYISPHKVIGITGVSAPVSSITSLEGMDKSDIQNSTASQQHQLLESSDADDFKIIGIGGDSATVSSVASLELCDSENRPVTSCPQKPALPERKIIRPRSILKQALFSHDVETYKSIVKMHTFSLEKQLYTQKSYAENAFLSVSAPSLHRSLKTAPDSDASSIREHTKNLNDSSVGEYGQSKTGPKVTYAKGETMHTYGTKVLKLRCMNPTYTDDLLKEYKEKCLEISQKIADCSDRMKVLDLAKNKKVEEIIEKSFHECSERKIVVALPEQEIVSLPQQDVVETYPPLSREMEMLVRKHLESARCSKDSITINKLSIAKSSLDTLKGLKWLNDDVINFYMELLHDRGQKENYPSVYCFNTFFYPKVREKGQIAVRRWTRQVDIFAHEFIVIPCHLTVHWSVTIVDFKKKTVSYYDSIGTTDNRISSVILKYLADEYKDKKGKEFDTKGWSCVNEKNTPRQKNGCDCGVFTCVIAEHIIRNGKLTFSQNDMPYFRKKIAYEIVTKKLLT